MPCRRGSRLHGMLPFGSPRSRLRRPAAAGITALLLYAQLAQLAQLALLALLALSGAVVPVSAHEADSVMIADITSRLSASRSPAHALVLRAEYHRASEEWDAAEHDLDDAAALDPALRELDRCRAALALDRGRPAQAREAISRYLARVPDDGVARWLEARAEWALGSAQAAAIAMDRALELQTRVTPEQIMWRATLADSLESGAAALLQLERGLVRLPDSAPLQLRAAELEVRLGRLDAALDRTRRMAQVGGDAPWLAERRGDWLFAAGQPLEAGIEWTDALQRLQARAAEHPPSLADRSRMRRLRESLDRSLAEPPRTTPRGVR